jgi:L-glyceraldehyde reductase
MAAWVTTVSLGNQLIELRIKINNFVILDSGRPKLTDDSTVQAVANRLGVTPAQVLLAWGVHRGYSVIPGSTNKDRMIENFTQIDLSQEDYEKVSSIGHNNRVR